MRKTLSIAVILLAATIAVPGALADRYDLPQPTAPATVRVVDDPAEFQTIGSPAPQTAVQKVIAQERARAGDPALFGPSRTPVQIVGPSDEFDLRDAGIGGATALALALLAAAALAFRSNRRRIASAAS